MLTRRATLQRAGAAAVLATTSPWWLVRHAYAARKHKLVVWNPAALAPQVDKLMQEQCFAYAKQAGLKEDEIDYSIVGSAQVLPKIVASLEAGNPPDITRVSTYHSQVYHSQGHLMDVTDLVTKMNKQAGGLFPNSLASVMHDGKAFSVPQSVSPWPLVSRMDVLNDAKVSPPKTWEELVEVCKKVQKPPKLTGFGPCLGLYSDTDNNIMHMIWSFGGKLVEADNKTAALHSKGTIAGVQFIADMYNKHKIIPKGATAWDNTGNNKAYQSRQVIFVLNPTSIYAHLADSDKELYNTTALLPTPAGPAGAFDNLSSAEWVLFKHNPYPEFARGLADYWMAPENLRAVIEEGDGRWGPPYQGMYDSDFWKRPVFQHWRSMLERGRQFPYPGTWTAAAGEVVATNVLARMIQKVLIENVEIEQAVEEAHKKVAEIYTRHAKG
ncbi:MAG: ABC transporter substrate-binding protein [Candidatus Tectimicrobiota bacterium]